MPLKFGSIFTESVITGLEKNRKKLHETGLNDYDERYHIKQRLKREWSKLSPIVPAAPEKYWNFSIFTGDYHLSTSLQDRNVFFCCALI